MPASSTRRHGLTFETSEEKEIIKEGPQRILIYTIDGTETINNVVQKDARFEGKLVPSKSSTVTARGIWDQLWECTS